MPAGWGPRPGSGSPRRSGPRRAPSRADRGTDAEPSLAPSRRAGWRDGARVPGTRRSTPPPGRAGLLALTAAMRCSLSPSPWSSRANAVPSHLAYGAYCRAISSARRMLSRTRCAVTTAEPRSSPISAVRWTNGSSCARRRHWHASSHHHTSVGYHASRRRVAVSSPRGSAKTGPATTSSSRCCGISSQSSGCRSEEASTPRCRASQSLHTSTVTWCSRGWPSRPMRTAQPR